MAARSEFMSRSHASASNAEAVDLKTLTVCRHAKQLFEHGAKDGTLAKILEFEASRQNVCQHAKECFEVLAKDGGLAKVLQAPASCQDENLLSNTQKSTPSSTYPVMGMLHACASNAGGVDLKTENIRRHAREHIEQASKDRTLVKILDFEASRRNVCQHANECLEDLAKRGGLGEILQGREILKEEGADRLVDEVVQLAVEEIKSVEIVGELVKMAVEEIQCVESNEGGPWYLRYQVQ